MTSIGGPSQSFRDLVTDAKKANGKEAANIINKEEASAIKNKLFEEVRSGNMTETEAVQYMKEAEAYLASEFKNTNVSDIKIGISDGSLDLDLGTSFDLEISGTIPTEGPKTKEVKASVQDYQQKAESDPDDKQYEILSKNKSNYIDYDSQGNAKGVHTFKNNPDGSPALKNGKPVYDKFVELPQGTAPNISDIIVNDFNKYADPPLAKTFPNNDKGANELFNALSKLDGVSTQGKDALTINDVKDLLNFIHTGTDGKGIENSVKRIQNLLEKATGDIGTEIREKNTRTGGDDMYGYATTLQIRSLAGSINEQIKNEEVPFSETGKVDLKDAYETKDIKTWLYVGDRSGSMEKKQSAFGELFKDKEMFNEDAKYTIAF